MARHACTNIQLVVFSSVVVVVVVATQSYTQTRYFFVTCNLHLSLCLIDSRLFDLPPQDEPTTVAEALSVIQLTHERWQSLMAGQAEHDADFWLGETPETAAGDGW